MTSQTRATLKGYFNTNDQPTEAHFADLIDSTVNIADTSPGIGTDEYALVWDNDTAQFVLRAPFDGTPYALLAGRAGGQTLYGGTAANDDLTLQGTAHGTKATSYVFIQPAGGDVVIGATSPSVDSAFNIQRDNRTECILIGGNLVGTALFSHAVADQTNFNSAGSSGYASYDAAATVLGTAGYNHFYGFQARPSYNGTGGGIMGTMSSFVAYPTITGPVTTYHGLHIFDALGAGVITNNYGIYIDDLVRGSVNWAIFANTTAQSFFGGNIISYGTIAATNFVCDIGNNSTYLGVGAGVAVASAHACVVGHNAGHSLANSLGNTLIGSHAGYSQVAGTGSVYVGYKAGYYETGDNKLFIDNLPRANEGDARIKALIYGVFDAAVSNQVLTINADLAHAGDKVGFHGVTPIARALLATGAGATVDNVITALQNLGLVKQS